MAASASNRRQRPTGGLSPWTLRISSLRMRRSVKFLVGRGAYVSKARYRGSWVSPGDYHCPGLGMMDGFERIRQRWLATVMSGCEMEDSKGASEWPPMGCNPSMQTLS